MRWLDVAVWLPAAVRRLSLRITNASPHLQRRCAGTIGLTSVGMFGTRGGWGLGMPAHTLSVTVGGIAQKPGVVQGRVEVREYLSVTLSFNHHIVDGGPAARFAQRFADLVEGAYGLEALHGEPYALPLVAAGEAGAGLQLLALDPARVAGVDYLLAEPDASPMSRWGHGMLRLVVCAPGRAPGPDCRLDLEHHLVLSFRAFVDDLQVSNWRGLTGGYPSRLFVLPLAQVVDEYTRIELRGLRSVPLRLGPDQVARLLERAARVHWSYDGRYRFVTSNCAVEAWKLLNDALPGLDGQRMRSITPTGLLRRLERAGIADASVFGDEAEALRLGHRFDSLARHFGQMYAVASAELALPARNADAWLRLDPAVRGEWLVRGGLRATAALLVLEEAALRQEQARARETLRRRYRRDGEGDGTVEALLQALWSDGAGAGRPAVLLPGPGYGLPQEAERELLATRVAEVDARLRAAHAGLYETALAWLPERQRRRLRDAEGNLERIGELLRALAAEAPD